MQVTIYAHPGHVTGTVTPSGVKWLTFGKAPGTVVDVCLTGLPPAVADALLAAAAEATDGPK